MGPLPYRLRVATHAPSVDLIARPLGAALEPTTGGFLLAFGTQQACDDALVALQRNLELARTVLGDPGLTAGRLVQVNDS
jgi:hypothetical protein